MWLIVKVGKKLCVLLHIFQPFKCTFTQFLCYKMLLTAILSVKIFIICSYYKCYRFFQANHRKLNDLKTEKNYSQLAIGLLAVRLLAIEFMNRNDLLFLCGKFVIVAVFFTEITADATLNWWFPMKSRV